MNSIGKAHDAAAPAPAPRRFFLLALPFGVVANGFGAISLPALLRQGGVAVADIGAIEGAFLVPLAFQFLWTIALEGRLNAGRVLRATALLAAAFCGAALACPVHGHLGRFLGLAFAGQVGAALSFACCGSIMATALPSSHWGRASGYAMAGVLGGGAIGGTLLTALASSGGSTSAALTVASLTALPALGAPSVPRTPSVRGVVPTLREAWRVIRSPAGRRLVAFAISPAGAAALLTLFSSLAPDYGVGTKIVALTNGLLGAGCMAVGSLVGGGACDRFATRRAWLWALSALLLGATALVAAGLPLVPRSYVGVVLGYDFLAGASLAIFPAVVLDVVGSSPFPLTLYALYYGIGVISTTYSTVIDSQFHDRHGPAGPLRADGALNIAGAIALALILIASRRRGPLPAAAISEI